MKNATIIDVKISLMSFIKLITEVVPQKTQILITNSRTPLAHELIHQLSSHHNLHILDSPDPSTDFPHPDSLGVIIHLAGFGSPSLAETLSHTSVLHRLLQLAHSHQAKFILVVPNSRQHLYHTAITLVTQFAKNFTISYQVLEIDKGTPIPETAAAIIKKFVYRHRFIPPSLPAAGPPASSSRVSAGVVSKSRKKSFWPDIRRYFSFILITALSIWTLTLFLFLLSLVSFWCSHTALRGARLNLAQTCGWTAQASAQATSAMTLLSPGSHRLFTHLGFPPRESVTVLGSNFTLIKSLASLSTQAAQVYRSLLSASGPPLPSESLATALSLVTENLAQMQTDLRQLYTSSPRPRKSLLSLASTVQSLHAFLSKLQSVWPPLISRLSQAEKFRLVLLVQDHTRSAATGGRLEAVVLFTLEQGRLTSIQVQSADSINRQLGGVADAPPDYRIATGQSTWLFQNSNWDPDFPSTANRVSWFMSRSFNFNPDLVISINTSAFSEFLKLVPPQSPSDSAAQFTSSNFTAQYLSYIQNHPDGSPPLGSLAQSIVTDLVKLPDSRVALLWTTLATALESGQLQLAPITFSLPLASTSWSREVGLPSCAYTQPCFTDYVLPVITNLADNHSDAYIQSANSLSLNITDSQITRIYSYSLNHHGTSQWPSGEYSGYLRLFLPHSSAVESIKLDGDLLTGSDYHLTTQHGLTVVGIPLKAHPGQAATLEVTVTQDIVAKSKFHYQLSLPSQPGLLTRPTTVTVTYPPSWFVSTYQQPSLAGPGRLEYNTPSQGIFRLNLDLNPSN